MNYKTEIYKESLYEFNKVLHSEPMQQMILSGWALYSVYKTEEAYEQSDGTTGRRYIYFVTYIK